MTDMVTGYLRKWIAVLLLALPLAALPSDSKTLLIINSFNENEPWVNDMIRPVLLDLASNPDVHCEIYDLNNALMKDSTDFFGVAHEIMRVYQSNPPEYVLMAGSLAFNMCRLIKDSWGDIPVLLLSTTKDYVPLKNYFALTEPTRDLAQRNVLISQQKVYNMTAIIIPQHYERTVDMMVQMLPQMQELVFMSDSIYFNRKMAYDILTYINDSYPHLKFSWLKANVANADVLHGYLVEKDDSRGLLLSTWMYSKHNITNWKTPSTSDLKLITASRNPVFTMHESYMQLGAFGGVFPASELAKQKELEIIHAMLEGRSMSDIPVYFDNDSYPCVSYPKLQQYGLPMKSCPEGTVFYDMPPTFFEKYLWQTIAGTLITALVIIILVLRNRTQQKKINAYKRNAEFISSMPIPYSCARVRYDTDDNVTTIAYDDKNEAFDRILRDNVMPESPFLLFPADFIAPKVTQLLKDGKTQTFIYHFDKTDSYYEFILCLVSTRVERDKDGKTKNIDIFAKDITKSLRMESNLASALRTLDLTIDVAQVIPWQYNLQRDTITYDYHSGDATLPHDDIEGEMSFETFLATAIYHDDQHVLRKLRDDVRVGNVKDFNVRLRKIDHEHPGELLWAELSGTVAAFDAEGKYRVVIGASRDITERVRHQREMRQALERANESDRMKSAFLASISHEIRTPLNSIVGFSNVIANIDDKEERMKFCDIINQNNNQLLTLIDDVLDLSKIESNAIDINYTETDLNELIDIVRRTMADKVPAGVRFSAIKGSNSCTAEMDRVRVNQILSNMISNACKFTPSGSITFGYDLTDHGMIHFYVRDTGIGISKENQAKVFDRFFKLDSFVPGTGLGLSICKNLVERMGGEIGVESAGESQGAAFWFTIPYVPCEDSLSIEDDGQFYKTRMPQLRSPNGHDRLKVLIAEDNESNYQLLEHLLHYHFDLVRAANGNEAVRAFIKERPDVVLMDISMPGMDGYTALREIRKFSASVPIIAVTAYVYASEKSKLLDFGFDGYVSKPITQKAIVDAIGHALMNA